jgi:hypothetical protein
LTPTHYANRFAIQILLPHQTTVRLYASVGWILRRGAVLKAKPSKGQSLLVKFIGEDNSYSWPSHKEFTLLTKKDIEDILSKPIKGESRKAAFEEALAVAADVYTSSDAEGSEEYVADAVSSDEVVRKPGPKKTIKTRSSEPKPLKKPLRKIPKPPIYNESSADDRDASLVMTEFNLRRTVRGQSVVSTTPASTSKRERSVAPVDRRPREPSPAMSTLSVLPYKPPASKAVFNRPPPIKSQPSTLVLSASAPSVASTVSSISSPSKVQPAPRLPPTPSNYRAVKASPATQAADKERSIASLEVVLNLRGDLWGSTAAQLYDLGFRDGSWLAWLNKVEMQDFMARAVGNPLSFLARARMGDLFEGGRLEITSTYERRPLANMDAEGLAITLNTELSTSSDKKSDGT